jgi:hypothetical protein
MHGLVCPVIFEKNTSSYRNSLPSVIVGEFFVGTPGTTLFLAGAAAAFAAASAGGTAAHVFFVQDVVRKIAAIALLKA